MKNLEDFYKPGNKVGPIDNYIDNNKQFNIQDAMHKIGEKLLDMKIDYNYSFNFYTKDNKIILILEGEKG
ncbi:hypothetical protein LDC_0734 [sediment metagenome]|uniref:Uncharacterized protein n=1 Tax=sediment metagenome TaxID=749907 RepID=D9PGT7_9ZZZZ